MRWLLALTIFITFLSQEVSSKNIYITYPDDINVYRDFSEKLAYRLQVKNNYGADLVITTSNSELNLKLPQEQDLIVSIGNTLSADEQLERYNSDILLTFSNSYKLNSIKTLSNRKKWGVINIDQPIKTLIDTAVKTIKSDYKKNILLIVSEKNKNILLQLQKLTPSQKNKTKIILIKEGDVTAKIIEPELFNAAAIVAIHDPDIWSGNSARWLLQQAYSYKVPIIGYSKSFLKAGAMVSIYSSVEQILDKTEAEITHWINTSDLNENVSTPKYNIEVNKNIARALNFSHNEIIELGEKQ